MENSYNDLLSKKWSESARKCNSQLFFALSANENGQVYMHWDNARGNQTMIDLLNQVVKLLENNQFTNLSEDNNAHLN